MFTKIQKLIILVLTTLIITGGVMIIDKMGQLEKGREREDKSVEEFVIEISEPLNPNENEPIGLDTDVKIIEFDRAKITQEITNILGDSANDYGVVLTNLNSGQSLDINADQVLPPASISKVPYAILTLKEIEEGKISFTDTISMQSHHYAYPSDDLYYTPLGEELTFQTLLESLLVDSDNTAMTILEDYFGGNIAYNERLNTLGLAGVTRFPHETTAADVTQMFQGIYSNTWLNKDSTNILYELMSKSKPQFSDRIVEGVKLADPEAKVVHKIGQIINDDYGETYHDAGLVFAEDSDMLIVILNNHEVPNEAAQTIQKITELFVESNQT